MRSAWRIFRHKAMVSLIVELVVHYCDACGAADADRRPASFAQLSGVVESSVSLAFKGSLRRLIVLRAG
jgi:hypothetical protein